MFETYSFPLIVAGIVLVLFSLFWLILRAFRTHPAWGFVAATGVGLPIYVAKHYSRARPPLVLLLIGIVLFGVPLAYNRFAPPDLGPREKTVNGEMHLTLTGWNPDKAGYRRWLSWLNQNLVGWDRLDYSMLRSKPDVAVLQIANPDVTDVTLEYLQGMDRLKELDLNDTKITDAGLAELAKLPKLTTLRLRGTPITDDGFRTHLLPLDRLNELDLIDTAVKSATVREWKAAKEGRKALK